MGKIESSLGERTFQSTGMKTYTVDDASGVDDPDFFQPAPRKMTAEEVMALREERMAGGNGGGGGRPDPNVKRRIEMLVGIGRQTRDVIIEDENGKAVYSIRTLKSKEMRALMHLAAEMAKAESVDTLYAIREQTLALSVFAIDGIDVDMVLGVANRSHEERLEARKMLFNEMNEYTLNYLYRMHEDMMAENAKLFSIKDAADAKEVAEQIRKSGQGA